MVSVSGCVSVYFAVVVRRVLLLTLALAGAITCPGCVRFPASSPGSDPATASIAPGVVLRTWRSWPVGGVATFVAVLDVDLSVPSTRVEVAAGPLTERRGAVMGSAHTVDDWCQASGAVAGVNGGFFGVTDGLRKEVIGLLVTRGVVQSGGGLIHQRNGPLRYARSALCFDPSGRPRIGWATGMRGGRGVVTAWERPTNPVRAVRWSVSDAVGCGPMLIHHRKPGITDRGERLVSDRRTSRTFVARVAGARKGPRLLLCVASSMTFQDAVAFLQHYNVAYAGGGMHDAMCLDGGSSTQMAAVSVGQVRDVLRSSVTVPTAVLVYAGHGDGRR